MSIPSDVRSFLEGILSDAGMNNMEPQVKEEMLVELFARLDNYIASVIVDSLPEDQVDTFIQMNEEKKPKEEIEAFLREKVPSIQDVFTKAFSDFRDTYLKGVTASRNAPSAQQGEN